MHLLPYFLRITGARWLSGLLLCIISILWNYRDSNAASPTPLNPPTPAHEAPLRFAVAETLLNDNWLTVPTNFTDHLISWDNIFSSAVSGSQARPPQWEAIMLSGEESIIGCAQGWLTAFYQTRCGKPAGYLHSALIWDKNRFPTPPGWPTLWDLVRYPGKRGLPRQARGALEIALLANNVPPAKIYQVLSTRAGQIKAFELLDGIRFFIAWYSTPAEFQQLLHNKELIIGVAPLSALTSETKLNIDPDFLPDLSHSIYSKRFWAIPAALPPSQRTHVEQVLDEAAPHLTYETPSIAGSSLMIDDSFWQIYAPTLEPIFDKWVKTGTIDFDMAPH
ncbi:extracellular solute-binding protein [Acetobacteraceae bacterium ESL0709]|nr:extracellular solute-binding protein [Acetobacteraceae bacterium ESL0697]MDF7677330.1 extracellular solute-binding protein [Acetobacteraceae bacterium ESL0709]